MSEKSPVPIDTWDPFRELDLLRDWPSMRQLGLLRPADRPAQVPWLPVMDVSESDSHFIATVELAGAKKEDVQVEVENGVLTIRGEKRSEREEENDRRRYAERSFGAFSRSIPLPSNADPDAIKATFEDGLLKVEIEKRDTPKPKAIQVH